MFEKKNIMSICRLECDKSAERQWRFLLKPIIAIIDTFTIGK